MTRVKIWIMMTLTTLILAACDSQMEESLEAFF